MRLTSFAAEANYCRVGRFFRWSRPRGNAMNLRILASAVFACASLSAYAYTSATVDHDDGTQIADANGHSGGTDRYGCHTNHSTGDYHCHNPR